MEAWGGGLGTRLCCTFRGVDECETQTLQRSKLLTASLDTVKHSNFNAPDSLYMCKTETEALQICHCFSTLEQP